MAIFGRAFRKVSQIIGLSPVAVPPTTKNSGMFMTFF